MKITPGIISEVVRVYKDKFPRSMRYRWEDMKKKKERSKEKKDQKCECGRSVPYGWCTCGRWHSII